MTKPTMELVEEFGFIRYRAGCVGHKSHEELNATSAALLSEIRQRLEAMERDAADGGRFVAFFSAFRTMDKRFLTAVHDALPAERDSESLDYIRAAIDAAMAEGEGHVDAAIAGEEKNNGE